MTKWENWKPRASEIGNLISKSGKLIQGGKSYLRLKHLEETRGYRKRVVSKYFMKGNLTEQEGLAMLNRTLYPNVFLCKNTESKKNDFLTGTCDIITPDDIVYDIKNAWDWDSFDRADMTKNYEWQLKAYCWLYGKKYARLMYCLNSMPEDMIDDEERRLFYAKEFPDKNHPEYEEARKQLEANFTYDNTPDWERFKIFDVQLTDECVETMKSMVIQAREYLSYLDEEVKNRISINKSLVYNE